MHCLFCHAIKEEQILIETENFKVVLDIDPIQIGHLLIISKAHKMHMNELTNNEVVELFELQKGILAVLQSTFSIHSASIIQNNGPIMDDGTHLHIHIVPRYEEDDFWENQRVVEHPLSIDSLKASLQLLNHQESTRFNLT